LGIQSLLSPITDILDLGFYDQDENTVILSPNKNTEDGPMSFSWTNTSDS
jgi:hypothetical protein